MTAESLIDLANWLYGFLPYGIGAFTILALLALLVGQELIHAYRGTAYQDLEDSVVNINVILPLLIAFLIVVAVQILRILHWL